MSSLAVGERLTLGDDAFHSFDGLGDVFRHLRDTGVAGPSDLSEDAYLEAWEADRVETWRAMGDPRGRWSRVWDWFVGRRYVDDLYVDVPVQLPIFHVAGVPHGTAAATYSVERSGAGGATLKIIGSGGGAGYTTALTESFEFEAARPPQMSSLLAEVEVTAHLFERVEGGYEIVTDIKRRNNAFIHTVSEMPAVPSSRGMEVARLIDAPTGRTGTYVFHAEREYSWDVDLGLKADVAGVGIEAGLSYEATRANGVEVKFVLPNGSSYRSCPWPGSLVPRITSS